MHAAGGGGGLCGAAGLAGAFNWSNHHCNVSSQPSPGGGGGACTQSG